MVKSVNNPLRRAGWTRLLGRKGNFKLTCTATSGWCSLRWRSHRKFVLKSEIGRGMQDLHHRLNDPTYTGLYLPKAGDPMVKESKAKDKKQQSNSLPKTLVNSTPVIVWEEITSSSLMLFRLFRWFYKKLGNFNVFQKALHVLCYQETLQRFDTVKRTSLETVF